VAGSAAARVSMVRRLPSAMSRSGPSGMNHRLRTPEGLALYRRRGHMVEAPNAWLKDRRGLRRFPRRGLGAAQAELAFASVVTNLLKIATNGVTIAQLQTR
jgi:hypothetical protein